MISFVVNKSVYYFLNESISLVYKMTKIVKTINICFTNAKISSLNALYFILTLMIIDFMP